MAEDIVCTYGNASEENGYVFKPFTITCKNSVVAVGVHMKTPDNVVEVRFLDYTEERKHQLINLFTPHVTFSKI